MNTNPPNDQQWHVFLNACQKNRNDGHSRQTSIRLAATFVDLVYENGVGEECVEYLAQSKMEIA